MVFTCLLFCYCCFLEGGSGAGVLERLVLKQTDFIQAKGIPGSAGPTQEFPTFRNTHFQFCFNYFLNTIVLKKSFDCLTVSTKFLTCATIRDGAHTQWHCQNISAHLILQKTDRFTPNFSLHYHTILISLCQSCEVSHELTTPEVENTYGQRVRSTSQVHV